MNSQSSTQIQSSIFALIFILVSSFLLLLSQICVPLLPSLFFTFSLFRKKSLKFWFILGFVFWFFDIIWILDAIKQGGFPTWVGLICLVALSAVLSSISLLPFGFLSNLFYGKIPFSVFVPSVWVSVEFLRIEVLKEIIPFPWAPLGIQFLHTPLAQISEFTGVWGLSFISALIGSAILDSILKRKSIYISVAISVSISALAFGIMIGKQIENLIKKQDEKNKLNVVALRTDFSREEKWKDVNLVLKKQIELTRNALEELRNEKEEEGKSDRWKSDYNDDFVLVIWPELSFPVPFFNLWSSEIRNITSEKVFLIFGAPEFLGKGNFYFYNSAFFIGENIKGVQRKEKLVPFGEYIPGGIEMWNFLGDFLKKKLFGGFFEPWRGKREIFEIDVEEKLKFSVLICWEVAFSDLVREALKGGVDFLVNISNDVWFGGRWGEMQMWNLVILRALENRIYIVRSTNKGVAGIIDPVGNFKSDDNAWYVLGAVGPRITKSICTIFGDVFIYVNIVFCVFLLSWKIKNKA
jgi:apolipoprotein N-acyltransferase